MKTPCSFLYIQDASNAQQILTVALEKIKIAPELIRLDEEDDNVQTTSQIAKELPNANFVGCAIPKIREKSNQKQRYQCEVCLETFSLLRYFRKHLALLPIEQPPNKCQEHYKFSSYNDYWPSYREPCLVKTSTVQPDTTTTTEQEVRTKCNENQLGNTAKMNSEVEICENFKQKHILMSPAAYQTTTCKECHFTCTSFKHLCIHYAMEHQLPVVTLNYLDNLEFSQTYTQTVVQKHKKSVPSLKTENVKKKENRTNCHICNICKQEFSSRRNLKRHQVTVNGINPLTCDICQRSFTQFQNLKIHKLVVHEGFRYTCDLCPKTFTTTNYIKQHRLTEHEGFRYKCGLCPKEFIRRNTLISHKQTTHEGVRYKCESCQKEFTQMSYLHQHKRTVHNGFRHGCDACAKTFKYLPSLRQHEQSVHNGVRHKCDSCHKEFTRLFRLYKHKEANHR